MNFVEIEQEEMMYLDGGWRDWIVTSLGGVSATYIFKRLGY